MLVISGHANRGARRANYRAATDASARGHDGAGGDDRSEAHDGPDDRRGPDHGPHGRGNGGGESAGSESAEGGQTDTFVRQ